MRPPLFEVTSPAVDAAARRLTTKENVKAALRITTATDDALVDQCIDQVSASVVTYCKMARPVGTTPPTFGAETLRATWFAEDGCQYRDVDKLVLPWRAVFGAIISAVEDGVTLSEGDDYELMSGGLLQRLDSVTSVPKLWSSGKIVVVYTAGWSLPTDVPPDLEGRVIEQVKLAYLGTDRDPGVRAQTIFNVEQTEFSVAGGTSIGRSGLLTALENALSPFKDWSQG